VRNESWEHSAGTRNGAALTDRPVTTREALRAYDPELFALVEETMAYKGRVDWRVKR
jgi:hypothetical protein